MALREPISLRKEIRINLEPSSRALVADVKLAAPHGSWFGSSRRRAGGADVTFTAEEKTFRTRNCATASELYHQNHKIDGPTPRSFLWRVLEEDTVLSIRNVDVCHHRTASDAPITVKLRFKSPIRPSCVAFADPQDHNAVSAFVLDHAKHLYHIKLKHDVFRRRSATDGGMDDSCTIYASSLMGTKTPHRLVAVNDDLLIAWVHDGGYVRFDRNRGPDAAQFAWKETSCSSRGWGQNFRSLLLKAGNTIRHGEANMEHDATVSVAWTDFGINQSSYLFAVCIDHRLRVWNTNNGNIVWTSDILNTERNPQDSGKWTIDPSHTNLIKLYGVTEGTRFCAIYSPVGAGQFKFWKAEASRDNLTTMTDQYPDTYFVPRLPSDSHSWSLVDFAMVRSDRRGVQIWVLWKNNTTHRVLRLSSVPNDFVGAWETAWTAVYADETTMMEAKSGPWDSIDVTEKWLQLILAPGRFTRATILSALSIYDQNAQARDKAPLRDGQGLAESICSVLAPTVTLVRASSGEMDYEQFRNTSDNHWRQFYRLLLELDKHRGEALSLAYDATSDMAWVVCADRVSAIRPCSTLEKIYHNRGERHAGVEHIATLLYSGLDLVSAFTDSMMQACNSALRRELYADPSVSEAERMQIFWDDTGFGRQLADEDCNALLGALGPKFKLEVAYKDMREFMNAPADYQRAAKDHPLTEFGLKLAVKAAQDMADLHWTICFSQLILLTLLTTDEEFRGTISDRMDTGSVYRYLIDTMRRVELIRWLGKTVHSNRLPQNSPLVRRGAPESSQKITALEGHLGHVIGILQPRDMASALRDIAGNVCAQDSDIALKPEFIQCGLLVRQRPDLAVELLPFCARDPFPTYVQGRVYLAMKDFSTAAVYFKKAAYGMSIPEDTEEKHSVGLLDGSAWKLLHAGQARYYQHIMTLYYELKVYSYTIEFACLALPFIRSGTEEADELRTEIHMPLFHSALNTSNFKLAHTTVISTQVPALQRKALRTLVEKMCNELHTSDLVELPFLQLENEVDEFLQEKCNATLDVMTGVPFHQILYAWRIRRNRFRAAAQVMADCIQKLRSRGIGDEPVGEDVLDTALTRQYLMLINVLSRLEPKQAWIAIDPVALDSGDAPKAKRRVATLADIRREYQAELDRINAIRNNQFGFAADDEMDIL